MRYVGLSINKGKGGGGKVQVDPFTRSSGITTDSSNHVTEVTLGDKEYKHIFYDNVGLITGFTEKVGGSSKGWQLTYNNQTEQIITDITEIQPTADPSYSFGTIANMNEGASQTINVTTTGVNNGTTLYWDIVTSYTNSSDWDSLTGSFTINNGAGSFTITSIADYTAEGNELFDIKLRTGSNSGPEVAISSIGILNDTSNTNVIGQQLFTGGGTWTCPANVSLVSVVCIGAGGGAVGNGGPGGGGGGGGALAYRNNIAVTAGQSYTVTVGNGGNGTSGNNQAGHGGNSTFTGDSQTVSAQGGRGANYYTGGAGGVVLSGTGGSGGKGGDRPSGGGGGGGGGAGGYSGTGGNGGEGSGGQNGQPGNGGGGGGGRAENGSNSYSGGGTHPYGEGGSGGGSSGQGYVGSYNSGSPWGNNSQVPEPGGGGGGRVWSGGQSGAQGCVRIIWGQGRAFPSTGTQDQ
tara:strand:+ start:120 stop:1502 length:1383 start_codon:yes stop_codon:yes gene_type:complete